MDEKSLIASLSQTTQNTWRDEKRPVLISNIPRLFSGADFRSVIGEEGVKAFVKRTSAAGGYKVVEDPNHKARIGIIPAGETFEFPELIPVAPPENKRTGEALLAFLNVLGDLTAEEQRSVVIPVDVIVRLLRK